MRKIYIQTKQNIIFLEKFPEILKEFSGKILIISLLQETRKLEVIFEVEDLVIYDNSDYINGTVSFNKALIEVNDNIDLLPSSYRMKNRDLDFNIIENEFENLDYDNIFVLLDDKLEIKNIESFITVLNKKDFDSNNIIFVGRYDKDILNKNIIGFLNQEKNDFDNLVYNLKHNKVIDIEEANNIFKKIKGLFKRNG